MEKPFYLVFRRGGSVPTIIYEDFEIACQEARRLAEKHRVMVHVLQPSIGIECKSNPTFTIVMYGEEEKDGICRNSDDA